MKNFNRIITPCACTIRTSTGYEKQSQMYVEINYEDGNLRIHGVVGPRIGGNCDGSVGQCLDELLNGTPSQGWNKGNLKKLHDIWEEWHLNDARPYCEHQKALGWREQAREVVQIYHYIMNNETYLKQRAAENAALAALKKGETFTPTEEQVKYASMPISIKTYNKPLEDNTYYRLDDKNAAFYYKGIETKTRGWIRYDECPELGLLSRHCPKCGYKYGGSWRKEEIPEEILEWLYNLPIAISCPAWI